MFDNLPRKSKGTVRPRVDITYRIDTSDGPKEVELPFSVGVLASLAGHTKERPVPLKKREFVEVNRENFHEVMARIQPRLALQVQNHLTDKDSLLKIELLFQTLKDFEPGEVAKQVPALSKLLEARNKLEQLKNEIEDRDEVRTSLTQLLANTEKAIEIAQQNGIAPESETNTQENPTEASSSR